ncbi:MAG: undecaprenyl/decaprenyl-phosphate alpha-N-acetylglucosaminyl 1-phosphate transferase [Oscillatoriophycideae cyanobacterium NC_groundwater_1537_Pr4_S-0.65um_50_18]|nr:undecaprenyl/decaprenyl-phosphate alpha-N-acetylglucosaminyl 1-phosphate transferase [Oscillatoriophycideae cyanobacterium NC_groundwater_1537_Pr4_S-0.65um_50_18]
MDTAIAFSMSLIIVLLVTPQVRSLGLKWGYVDQPGQRKVHHRPMVRVGGIAIVLATLLSLMTLYGLAVLNPEIGGLVTVADPFRFNHSSADISQTLQFAGVIIGSILFFMIGLADDIFSLSASKRLLLQAIVTCCVWSLGIRVEQLPIPWLGACSTGIFSLPLTFLWLAGVTNAINWIDGLDGLASGVSSIAAGLLALLCWQSHPAIALVAVALMGATLGFLRYNANPAQIFMGDGGSYFIGYVLASVSAIGLMQQANFTTLLLPYLVLAVPIIDMARVILTRLSDRKSPFFADQRHLHHRLLQTGLSVKSAVYLIYSLALWLGSWAIALHFSYGLPFLALSSLLLIATSQSLWKPLLSNLLRQPSIIPPQ